MRRRVLYGIVGVFLLCLGVSFVIWIRSPERVPGEGSAANPTSQPAGEADEAAQRRLKSLGYLNP
jgi:hypothetical protein